MPNYSKGANAERELMQFFAGKGFSVARVAGSGSNSLPCPDMIALKGEKRFALEVKSVFSDYLNIPLKQLEQEMRWAENAGMKFFVAWKLFRKGFFLIEPGLFKKNKKNFSVSLEIVLRKGIPLKNFFFDL